MKILLHLFILVKGKKEFLKQNFIFAGLVFRFLKMNRRFD